MWHLKIFFWGGDGGAGGGLTSRQTHIFQFDRCEDLHNYFCMIRRDKNKYCLIKRLRAKSDERLEKSFS